MDGAALQISGEVTPCDTVAEAVDRSAVFGGEDARLRRAFDRCGDELFRFIVLRVRGDRHTAEDLLQQSCYEAARKRRIPDGDDAAQAWLFGIAKNLIRKHFRRLRREQLFQKGNAAVAKPSEAKSESIEPGTHALRDLAPSILTAIAALTPADQELLFGSYFEGRSHEQLAAAIGISVRAIEGRLYRARAALREVLGNRLGDNDP